MTTLTARWFDVAQALETWVYTHDGTLPRTRGGDELETRVGSWLKTQRSARGTTLSDERHAWLDEHIPGWAPDRDETPTPTEVARFVAAYGHLPRPTTIDPADPRENKLGAWLVERRRALRKGTLPPVLRADLDAQVPGWDTTVFPTLEERITVDEVCEFRRRTGYWPAATRGTPHARLGAFLQTRRKKGYKVDPIEDAKLSALDPNWRIPDRKRHAS